MEEVVNDDSLVFRFWWPLLLGLSSHVADVRVQVRSKALSTLTNVLKTYGAQFSSQTWDVIFKGVLFPMVDSAKTDDAEQVASDNPAADVQTGTPMGRDERSWIATMCYDVLTVCVLMFDTLRSLKGHSSTLLPDLVFTIEGCICQEREGLARIGLRALHDLIKVVESTATPDAIGLLCSKLHDITLANLCKDFGPLGAVRLSDNDTQRLSAATDDDAPQGHLISPSIISFLLDQTCPVANRRSSSTAVSLLHGRPGDDPPSFMTPFGPAKLLEVRDNDGTDRLLPRALTLTHRFFRPERSRCDLLPVPLGMGSCAVLDGTVPRRSQHNRPRRASNEARQCCVGSR
jgi:hypothetical protein